MQRMLLILALVTAAQTACPQTVISLRAGLLNYVEGRIEASDSVVGKLRVGAYHLKAGEQLRTRRGRAELLLSPSVFLRLADETSVSMEKDALDDVEVLLLNGTVVVDVVDLPKDNRVRIQMGTATAELAQPGIYRFDAEAGGIRVFDGKAEVSQGGSKISLKKGKMLVMSRASAPVDFDRNRVDRAQRWSARRSLAVAESNLQSARTSYGPGWRRLTRMWVWSIYMNAPAARASLDPVPSGG
jgi:hypothetical protein